MGAEAAVGRLHLPQGLAHRMVEEAVRHSVGPCGVFVYIHHQCCAQCDSSTASCVLNDQLAGCQMTRTLCSLQTCAFAAHQWSPLYRLQIEKLRMGTFGTSGTCMVSVQSSSAVRRSSARYPAHQLQTSPKPSQPVSAFARSISRYHSVYLEATHSWK